MNIFRSTRKIFFMLAITAAFLAIMPHPAAPPAFAETDAIRAGVYLSPPFVMKEAGGTYSGMAMDLWNILEDRLGITSTFVEYASLESLIRDTVSGKVDIIISNLIVTHERARHLNFSFPWYDSGTRILINTGDRGSVLEELRRTGHLNTYIAIFSLFCVLTVLLTILRRKRDPEFTKKWSDGLAVSLYEIVVAAKSGRFALTFLGWFGYLMSTVWMLFGIALIAYVTSTVTSAMTTVSLTEDISSYHDLPGRTVGVIEGSAESRMIRRFLVKTVEYPNIEDAIAGLEDEELDAVVGDAPVLEYWARAHPSSGIQVVGGLFFPNKFAFAANRKLDSFVDDLSVEIIRLHETGILSEIKDRYFEAN